MSSREAPNAVIEKARVTGLILMRTLVVAVQSVRRIRITSLMTALLVCFSKRQARDASSGNHEMTAVGGRRGSDRIMSSSDAAFSFDSYVYTAYQFQEYEAALRSMLADAVVVKSLVNLIVDE